MLRFGKNYTLQSLLEKNQITKKQFVEWKLLKTNIDKQQKKLKELHEEWKQWKEASKKPSKFLKQDDYQNALKEVTAYRYSNAHIMLQNHVRLFTLTIRILGRLLDYSGLWERNLYFVFLALTHQKDVFLTEKKELKGKTYDFSFEKKLKEGQIVSALSLLEEKTQKDEIITLLPLLKRYMTFSEDGALKESNLVRIRDSLAHFAMLHGKNFNLTHEINQTRILMAHDRKLKNAVSKSIIELMAREELILNWGMKDHNLSNPEITPKKIYHLKNKQGKSNIVEDTFDKKYLDMAKGLFSEKMV